VKREEGKCQEVKRLREITKLLWNDGKVRIENCSTEIVEEVDDSVYSFPQSKV